MDDAFYQALGILLLALGLVSIVGYVVLQPLLPLRLSGGWRIAALLPLAVMVPLAIHAIVLVMAGSNLWPLGLISFAPLAFLYLLIVGGARMLVARARR
jgi:hypothetical protein